MTPEEWKRIKVRLHDLLIGSADLRSARLAALAQEFPDLRDELDELVLSFDSMSPEYLNPADPAWKVDTNADGPQSDLIGTRMGPYEIVEAIGRGGMGEVFRAVRNDGPVHVAVAIKVIRAGQDSPPVLKRFEQERRILAGLDHANIARLLDAGTSDQGSPYFVMELIEGSRLLDFCVAKDISVEERLKLFIPVCHAVDCAHRQGVIHRDIKPGNILVTRDGVPKLLDFGIAKLLDSGFSNTISSTVSLFRPLTPAYASPEQVRADHITHSTDIYSLGVVLYELLCGQGPYGEVEPSPDALGRAVCDSKPLPPSRLLAASNERNFKDQAGLHALDLSPHRDWPKRFREDLDTIVLTCLRKEPKRRYPFAEALAKDIEALLEGKSISARRDSLAYRAVKFGQRRPALPFFASLLVIATATALSVWIWRGRHPAAIAPTPANHAPVRRSLAVLSFKFRSGNASSWVSTAISEMLNKTLAAGGQLRTIDQDLVQRSKTDLFLSDSEFYDQRQLIQLQRALHTDLAVFGSISETAGRLRIDLVADDTRTGETVASVSESASPAQIIDLALQAGIRMRQRLGLSELTQSEKQALAATFPSNPEAIHQYAHGLRSLNLLDGVEANKVLLKAVKLDPSHALSHAALSNSWSLLGSDKHAADEARLAMQRSTTLSRSDQLAIEARYYSATHRDEDALERYRTLFGLFPDDLEYGLRLADFESNAGKGQDALATVATLRRLPDPVGRDPRIDLAEANAAGALGDFHHEVTAASNAAQKAEADGSRSLIAGALFREAIAFRHLKDVQNAKSTFQAALAIYQAIGDTRGSASAFNGLGNVIYQEGDLAGARHTFEQAVVLFRKVGDRKALARSLNNLANVIGDMGDLDGSMKMYMQLLKTTREIDNRHDFAESLSNIGTIQILQGELSKAKGNFDQALTIFREQGDIDYVGRSLDNLGVAQLLMGNPNGAILTFTEEAADFRKAGDEGSLPSALCNLGQAFTENGNLGAAEQNLNDALALARKRGDRLYEAQALSSLALVYLYQGKLEDAKKNDEDALGIRDAIGERYTAEETRLALAEVLLQLRQPARSDAITRQALKELQAEHMKDDQVIAHALLARILAAQHRPQKAGPELQSAERLGSRSQNPGARFSLILAKAETASAASSPNLDSALGNSIAEAHRRGMLPFEYKLRLALASNDLAIGGGGRCGQFESLQNEAVARGFRGIADSASSACKWRSGQ